MNWLKRFQDLTGWLPLALLGALGGWVLLGSVSDRDGLMRWLIELFIVLCYAFAASGVTYLAWRRWSTRLTAEQLDQLWAGIVAGQRGPLAVYIVNAVFYLCAFIALLCFFRPPR